MVFRRCGIVRRRGPTLRTHQRYEADIRNIFGLVLKLRNTRHTHQFLDPPVGSNRNHQPSTDFELGLQ